MKTTLIEQDKKQRQLALDATQSFIVQAPAGSGKTELLIQRFLTLLNHVQKPEEILAITFTKKAANEMRTRVIKALKQAMDVEPASEHAKQTWRLAKLVLERDKQFNWQIIQNPNQLRIQTIDSLCTHLTKQLPLLSHFGSAPSISDNPATLYREAVQEVLTHVEENYEWSQAISQLLLHLDNDLNKLHDLCVNLLSKRDQWLPYIQLDTQSHEIKVQLEHQLALVIRDCLSNIRSVFPKEIAPELIAIARFAADHLPQEQQDSPIRYCRSLSQLPGIDAKDKEAWLGLAQLVLTKSFSWRKRLDKEIGFPALSSIKNAEEKRLHTEYRERLTTLIESLAEREDIRVLLADLFLLPKPYYQEDQWAILQSLLTVLKIVAAQLRLTFQQHGQIDFIENAQAALTALGNEDNPTDLALALDYRIQHILLDEFQDTSYSQYQLLEKLTLGWQPNDGRTLFVVGDPMQSIYRFREAEVGLFIRMRKNGIGDIQLTPLTLMVNFRSMPVIIEWNNAHFEHIFPSFNDMATGAVTYSPSVSHQSTTEGSTEAFTVKAQGFLNTDEQTQADHIISLINELKENYPGEKIAILVRSRTHLSTIIPSLKKAKIPYCAVDIDPLAARQPIQDLLSLTCALLHPADRIAWLSILRAPWCGLQLTDLFIIAGENAHSPLWDRLTQETVIQQLSVDGKERLARILPILKQAMSTRERYDLRTWIESTWLLLGGPACLLDSTDMDDVRAFFRLINAFDQQTKILNLDKLKEKINQLYASTQHDDALVQIMTIHTAKGLEFDSVILPHLERKMPYDDKSLLMWMEQPLANDRTALLLAPIHATGDETDPIYDYISRCQRIKSNYEIDRLLYVATTRAKKRLYLFFDIEQNESEEFRIDTGSFLSKLWPFFEKQANQILIKNEIKEESKLTSASRSIMRLAPDWKNPVMDTRSSHSAIHQKMNGFLLVNDIPKFIGIVTHKLLQKISEHGVAWWKNQSALNQENYIRHQLIHLCVPLHAIRRAIKVIQQSITNTLEDVRGQWILHPHKEAKSEFAITARLNNQLENLIIDRMFVDENDVRWIVDYKTTTFSHEDLDEFLDKEQEKYLEKMQTYRKAIQLFDNRPIKLGLYFPALPAWKEWE